MNLDRRIYRLTIYRVRPTLGGSFFFPRLPTGIVVSALQLEATIEKSLGKQPNKCDLKVRNMSQASRAEVQRDGIVITLDAGYDDAPRRLFCGDLTYSYSTRDGTDWVTELQVGDGTLAFAGAHVNRSFKAGTQVIDVLRECAKSMNLTLPANVQTSAELKKQFAIGYALNGNTRDELTRLLAPYGYSWSLQGGRLQILRDDETRPETARVLSQGKGMIGTPIFGKPEKKGQPPKRSVKNLLYPELTPGGKVQVESELLDGVFKIEKTKHVLDFEGQEWSTEVEIKQA